MGGCRLLEVDFSSIEAVQVGWFAKDQVFMRLAKLGVHGYYTALQKNVNVSLSWSDEDLSELFKEMKKAYFPIYDEKKRTVYLSLYGGGPGMMCEQFPETFPTKAKAEAAQKWFFEQAPLVRQFQAAMREIADRQHFLGGTKPYVNAGQPGSNIPLDYRGGGRHPFGYKHWFWDVMDFEAITEAQAAKRRAKNLPVKILSGRPYSIIMGNDWKRAVAVMPQGTAAGNIREVTWHLTHPDSPDYIGDCFYGTTPLRALIHDSLLLEVPDRTWDYVLETVVRRMTTAFPQQPLPEEWGGGYLSIGVEAKAGRDWGHMEVVDLKGLTSTATGVSTDTLADPDWITEDPEDPAAMTAPGVQAVA